MILIGMSGAGKSTLGVLLAKALGLQFIDTDLLLQQQEGRLLQAILDQEGIEGFMDIEETLIADLQVTDSVISTGGSVVYSDLAMQNLKRQGRIVYLHVPYEEIEKRVVNLSTRGIVMRNGNTLQDVYEERLPLYRKYSDLVLDCSGREMESCVSELIRICGEAAGGTD